MKKITWYIQRLRVMQPKEILHRVKEQWFIQWMYIQYSLGLYKLFDKTASKHFSFCETTKHCLPELPWCFDIKSNKENIHHWLEGYWFSLGTMWQWKIEEENWHKVLDNSKDIHWPKKFFNKIPYRAGNPYGDVRITWEPARLQQLIPLALIINSDDVENSQKRKAIQLFMNQIEDWWRSNPTYKGIHYISSMECGLRIIALCHALDMIRKVNLIKHSSKEYQNICVILVNIVHSHAHFITKRLSLHSSAGNHTIAEAVGLLYAGLLFPEMKSAKNWTHLGVHLLNAESERQILMDGGSSEQAFCYLVFVTDLYGLATKLLKYVGQNHSQIEATFLRAQTFINQLAQSRDELPNIGDGDNGYALSKFLNLIWSKEKESVDEVEKQGMKGDDIHLITYAESGYSLIHHTNNKLRLIMDHGDLGMQPSFGHGHADALSVVLDIDEQRLCLDTGTYSYTGHPKWRRYFRSTQAHNTVVVDNSDQALQKTAFMWSQAYEANVVCSEKKDNGKVILLAYHTGYQAKGVIHWRGIMYQPSGDTVIWDFMQSMGSKSSSHYFSLYWHLNEGFKKEEDYFVFEHQDIKTYLKVSGGDVNEFRASETSLLGWQAPYYGVKKPCLTLQVHKDNVPETEFLTVISSKPSQLRQSFHDDVLYLKKCIFHHQKIIEVA